MGLVFRNPPNPSPPRAASDKSEEPTRRSSSSLQALVHSRPTISNRELWNEGLTLWGKLVSVPVYLTAEVVLLGALLNSLKAAGTGKSAWLVDSTRYRTKSLE